MVNIPSMIKSVYISEVPFFSHLNGLCCLITLKRYVSWYWNSAYGTKSNINIMYDMNNFKNLLGTYLYHLNLGRFNLLNPCQLINCKASTRFMMYKHVNSYREN